MKTLVSFLIKNDFCVSMVPIDFLYHFSTGRVLVSILGKISMTIFVSAETSLSSCKGKHQITDSSSQ